ncbi:gamma-glutamyl-gamma-aminobutyrate hydrolase family protein [candidate division WOR-3 bacterium]|jgi:GMP synthase-like glutamine amidotransferase|nr:gamma-glutamyl-gamma-aminobutyrate hydrolase family protein [candidate division WOR-3 bacterium]
MRTLIIDNYLPNSPQLEHLYDIVKDITVHTVEVKEYSAISSGEDFKLFDAIVLSGSQHKLAESEIFEAYASEVEFLRRTKKPVLGICFGHQLISMAFGESVISTGKMLKGYYMIRKIRDDELFGGLSEKFLVMESHEEIIQNVPYNFVNLADSPNCAIETIKHQVLPIYGVQFHPERFDDKHPAGIVILENFFNIATLYMK